MPQRRQPIAPKNSIIITDGSPRSIGNRFTDLLVALNRNRQLPSLFLFLSIYPRKEKEEKWEENSSSIETKRVRPNQNELKGEYGMWINSDRVGGGEETSR